MQRGDTWAARAAWEAGHVSSDPLAEAVLDYYDSERAGLERYLRFQGFDEDTCRDIVHDAFVKMYEHLRGLGDHTNLRAWLYTVVQNLARNRRSAANAARTVPLPEWDLRDASGSPEDLASERERSERLQAGIAGLTDAQRQCVVLRAQGFKYREIASVLQLSTSTVAENVQRAIAHLRNVV